MKEKYNEKCSCLIFHSWYVLFFKFWHLLFSILFPDSYDLFQLNSSKKNRTKEYTITNIIKIFLWEKSIRKLLEWFLPNQYLSNEKMIESFCSISLYGVLSENFDNFFWFSKKMNGMPECKVRQSSTNILVIYISSLNAW